LLPGMQVRYTLQLNLFFALSLILPFLYTATTTTPSSQTTTLSPQTTTPSSQAPISSHQATTSSTSPKGGLSPGAIAGIVTGVIIGVVLALAAFFVWWRWRHSHVVATPQPVERESKPLPQSTNGTADIRELEDHPQPSELGSEPTRHDSVSPTQGPHQTDGDARSEVLSYYSAEVN
jgi:beta-lactamase regulating signal transducer with metallopeptidase domain